MRFSFWILLAFLFLFLVAPDKTSNWSLRVSAVESTWVQYKHGSNVAEDIQGYLATV